jgi:hypothetical protein
MADAEQFEDPERPSTQEKDDPSTGEAKPKRVARAAGTPAAAVLLALV